jgi:integrase
MTTTNDLVAAWAAARTDPNSPRYHDLIRDKTNALLGRDSRAAAPGFFPFVGKPVHAVTGEDVRGWTAALTAAGLAPTTIYARVSRVSSFYAYLIGIGHTGISHNPASDARPSPPAAYSTSATRPLEQGDIDTLMAVVRERSLATGSGALSAKRDLALLHFYFGTGARRAEIIGLCWGDIQLKGRNVQIVTTEPPMRVAGGRAPLEAYLRASGRWDDTRQRPKLAPTAPLWLRHDRAAKGQAAVTSHGFVYMLKQYAKAAGIPAIHLNQARHTAALHLADDTDPIAAVQQRLGFQSRSMARAYLRQLQDNKGDNPPSNV